jgi:predicted nucleotide-binding protein
MTRALVVEDDHEFAKRCIEQFLKGGFEVDYAENAEKAKAELLNGQVDLVLIDLMLPPSYDDEGWDLLQYVRARFPGVEVFLMTTREKKMTELVAKAMQTGARFFFDKNSDQFQEELNYQIEEFLMERRNNIFISHGHSEVLKLKLKDFISNRLHRNAIILADQPSRGLTVVEKLEQVSEKCCFAIVMMTKDDEQKEGGLRARQNVVHELGFFQGKYGRKNVVLLAETGVETFSNISGIVRIEFDAQHFETAFEPLRIEIEAALATP